MKKGIILIILLLHYANTHAQQWIDKKYQYDSLLNVTYGTAINFNGGIDTLKLDIYTPVCDDINHISRKPLLIWIHGGAFLAGDKEEASISNLCKQFAKRGYVTAGINYRLGFISDDVAWNCNYPNYSCVFATDSAEWYRAWFRAIQDSKGALRYLINRNSTLRIDTDNVFIAGESAGAITALGVGLLDTLIEKPVQAYAIADAPKPNNNALGCDYNTGKTFPDATIQRPDLGVIDGTIEPTTINYTIKGIGNMYGAMMSDLLKLHAANKPKPAIYSFHQPCDLVVPIDSGNVYAGLSWCMTNGYGCYGITNTSKLYGSRAFSNWNTNNNYGYNIHNEFTATNFPYSFLIGAASCADQVNNPCHGYDNAGLRENNLALFFAPLVTTSPVCDTLLYTATSVEKNKMNSFIIYPDPAADILTVECTNYQNCKLSIYNIMGEAALNTITLQNQKTEINIKELHAGIYIISFLNRNGMTTVSRLIKQ